MASVPVRSRYLLRLRCCCGLSVVVHARLGFAGSMDDEAHRRNKKEEVVVVVVVIKKK